MAYEELLAHTEFFEDASTEVLTALLQHAVADLGHFQIWIDFDADAFKLAVALQPDDEITQISITHSSTCGFNHQSAAMPAKMTQPTQFLLRNARKQPSRLRFRIRKY